VRSSTQLLRGVLERLHLLLIELDVDPRLRFVSKA
jgi:hypothetical protein